MTSLVRHDQAAAEPPLLAADGTPLEVLSGTTADKDLAGLRPSKKHGRPTAREMQPDCEAKPRSRKLDEKRDKYADMGVEEFWVFDPFGDRVPDQVAGYRLHDR